MEAESRGLVRAIQALVLAKRGPDQGRPQTRYEPRQRAMSRAQDLRRDERAMRAARASTMGASRDPADLAKLRPARAPDTRGGAYIRPLWGHFKTYLVGRVRPPPPLPPSPPKKNRPSPVSPAPDRADERVPVERLVPAGVPPFVLPHRLAHPAAWGLFLFFITGFLYFVILKIKKIKNEFPPSCCHIDSLILQRGLGSVGGGGGGHGWGAAGPGSLGARPRFGLADAAPFSHPNTLHCGPKPCFFQTSFLPCTGHTRTFYM